MRRLLTVLVAIALAVLPFGGVTGRAFAASHGQSKPCHHGAEAVQSATKSEHSGHHQRRVGAGHGGMHEAAAMHEAAMHHEHGTAASNPAPCPDCGPRCHCLVSCVAGCGALADNIGAMPAREVLASTVAPADAATPSLLDFAALAAPAPSVILSNASVPCRLGRAANARVRLPRRRLIQHRQGSFNAHSSSGPGSHRASTRLRDSHFCDGRSE